MEGSNGYAIDVYSVEPPRSERARLVIQVYDGDSLSTYSTFAKKSKSWIRGDLGAFGHVAVRFHRDGDRWIKSRCSKPRHVAGGRFVGELEFHGEGGYADFPAQAVRVEPLYHLPSECASVGEAIGGGQGVLLRVLSKFTQTSIVQNRPGGAVRIGAVSGGEIDGVEVEKSLEVLAPARDFSWTPDLKRATLRPPAPFFGEAVYSRLGRRESRWSGNLKAEFPGWPPIRLTKGPSFPPSSTAHAM